MHPIDKKKKRGLVQEKMKAGVGMEAAAAAARLMVVVAVLGILIGGVSGQGTPNCENDLRPCVPAAANVSVKPDSYCCSVVKKAVVDDLDCLCDLYYKSGTTFFETLQINKTRVLEIITMCGINDPLSLCNHAPGSLPAPSSHDPQTAPPPTAGVDSSNAASRLRWAMEPWLALAWLLLSITHRPLIL